MKKLIIIFILCLPLVLDVGLFAQNNGRDRRYRKEEVNVSKNDNLLGGGYVKDHWSVYYNGRELKGASASSFVYLGGGYAKDSWTVFLSWR